MTSIYFIAPYKPIMCGIADYTSFLTRKCSSEGWGAITFDLSKYNGPLTGEREAASNRVWYGIPDRHSYNEAVIMDGLDKLGGNERNSVLWFQHEFGIWPHNLQFIAMLKNLKIPKIVSLHTLHFQSEETLYGLRRKEYYFLCLLLPHVDAITVFSHGVYQAITSAFPEYRDKVYNVKHGVHSYPEVRRLSHREAKQKLNDFLLYESDLDEQTKKLLHTNRVLTDHETIVIGQTGFLAPYKGSELLYRVRDSLQNIIPCKKIVAVRIGSPMDKTQEVCAHKLQKAQKRKPNNLFLKVWLPENILPVAQRAFDINFYWPVDCTQSGVLAHALGTGTIVAGRDLEGVGETLKDAGELVDTSLARLTLKIGNLIFNPGLVESMEETILDYAQKFCWANQVQRHYELVEQLLSPMYASSNISKSLQLDALAYSHGNN